MIRPLTVEDLPKLCPILDGEARVRMRYPERLCPDYFVALWAGVIDRGMAMCFVDDQGGDIIGFLLGLEAGDLFSGRPIALEHLWYVRGEHPRVALRLLNAFMADAARRNCVRAMVGDWFPVGGKDLSRLYERYGFVPLERYFSKELVCP